MIAIILLLALDQFSATADVYPSTVCRAAALQVMGCVSFAGPTPCEAMAIWGCTLGGDAANVALSDYPWTWPQGWKPRTETEHD